jgi:ketosteroid isomerase-like protein
MRRVLAATCFLALLVAPTSEAQAPAVLRTEIQSFVRAYTDSANKADITTYTQMYSRQAGVTSIDDGTILRGWDAIRTQADSMLGREGAYKVEVGSIDITPLGVGYILAVAPTTITLQTNQGAVQIRGALTLVLHKTAEGWKIIHDHTSSMPVTGGE